jgi:anti-sigma B factor antagonist
MSFEIRAVDGVTVVEPTNGRIDMETSAAFKMALDGVLASGARRVVLNLSQVGFMDSAGLGAIMSLFRQINGDGSLHVCGLHPRIKTLFDITRLTRVVGIHPSEAEAISAARPTA